MKVFVETESGSSFAVEVDYLDTVLKVKQKIENSQRIPVSKQILSFDGMVLRDEDDLHDVEKCQIFNGSRLQLFVSPDHNPNHDQTEQSPPSNSTVKAETEHTEEFIADHKDSRVKAETEQTEETIESHQDSNETVKTEKSPDSPVEVTSENRVPKKKIVVYVSPYSLKSKSAKVIPVGVKMSDNVKELRNELVKIEEKGVLNLPQEGYFFVHKNRLLNEDHSFWVAGIDQNSTIEILPKHLIYEYP